MRPDFALIGHMENWGAAAGVLSVLRGPALPPIPPQDLREILPWIPPRTVCRGVITSSQGHQAHGIYIDCFIPPDRLADRENLARVRQAVQCAIRSGAPIATLGGFSSILLESSRELLPSTSATAFTTGNTLTVALILRGVERALELAGRDLSRANVLIVGATGDVGSGCARCLAPRVARLLLCARNLNRLQTLAAELPVPTEVHTRIESLSMRADLVICAASLPAPSLSRELFSPQAIVCDAGYPRNTLGGPWVFLGGLGQARGGVQLDPDLLHILNPQPFPNILHGCLLEALVLALDHRFEPFSQGRGRITPQRVEEIWTIAQKHGVALAPV